MARNILLLTTLALILAACGTVATPVFQEELEQTEVALAATSEAETAAAPTATPTDEPTEAPTATPTQEPTDTPPPATSTPEPTDTAEPTEAPTEAEETPEAEDADEGDGDTTGGAATTGDPASGEALFTTFIPEASFACNTCHLVDSEAQLIGPGLLGIGERTESRVPEQSPEEYLHTSIVDPSAYVVEGFPDMLMPQVYEEILTEEQINDLVAYLLTL